MAGDKRLTRGSGRRVELEAAWKDRAKDAEAMLAAERFASAIASGLYAVEILLKSLICKRLEIDFLPAVFEIHDLEALMLHAGLRRQLDLREAESLEFQRNWAFIREIATKLNEFRYLPDHPESRGQALRFFEQLRHPEDGSADMAYGTDLRGVLREVIRGLVEFAKARDWNDDDYWIYYQLNEDMDRVNIVFVASGFNDKDDFESYRAVWESLQNQMADHPEDLRRVNLVVHSESQVQQGGIYSIGRDYNEYFTSYPSGTFS